MKKIIFALAVLFSVLMFTKADAQLSISINIGSQPTWGPTGYNHVDYYYFPDIDCYYYVPTRQFIYLSGSTWVYALSLPPQYGHYDLYNGYKVVVNGVQKPYLRASYYRTRYSSYRNRRGQSIIRDSHDPKYRPGYRPGGNRPPVRPLPKPQPKPQPSRPGHDNRPPVKPDPGKPGNGGRPPVKPQPGRPTTKPAPGDKGGDRGKDDRGK